MADVGRFQVEAKDGDIALSRKSIRRRTGETGGTLEELGKTGTTESQLSAHEIDA